MVLSSRDGYCTLVVFDDILPAHHTQQHTLQLQSIAQHHAVPLTYSLLSYHASSFTHVTPATTPATTNVSLPFVYGTTPGSISGSQSQTNTKRREPPLTPAASVDGLEFHVSSGSSVEATQPPSSQMPIVTAQDTGLQEPPKKKRRVALTRVGDLDS